uniref:Uncharacterized protein n=1 Tax=Pithovirus LCPAC001 TaxID=2506585 RepID=A0A481Z3N2_9VIRU|nr:MAG: hypothetical protein LCPAC001_01580 [Pithovirus LCPAC001]
MGNLENTLLGESTNISVAGKLLSDKELDNMSIGSENLNIRIVNIHSIDENELTDIILSDVLTPLREIYIDDILDILPVYNLFQF